jgi:hypothetical protein
MPVASLHDPSDCLPNIPAPFLAKCDHVANAYAASARSGLNPPPFSAIASAFLATREMEFLEWCGQLGYREGLETRS